MKGATCSHAPVHPTSTVSIHAPVKGATVVIVCPSSAKYVSIHAPVKGATWYNSPYKEVWDQFQSTHP